MPPSDMNDLRAAWRALAGAQQGDGWQTIPVAVGAPCSLFAGSKMPGGEEALLVGFRGVESLPDSRLPQGHGFEVLRVEAPQTGEHRLVVALARRPSGSPELFAMMAEDLVLLLDGCTGVGEATVLRRFLARIHAWQEFMNRHRDSVLSAENEQGLFGELVLLERLLDADLPPQDVLDAWLGPANGLQDFILGSGGIEVKTTLSAGGFRRPSPHSNSSTIACANRSSWPPPSSPSTAQPWTLPEMVDVIKERLSDDHQTLETFDIRLMQVGTAPLDGQSVHTPIPARVQCHSPRPGRVSAFDARKCPPAGEEGTVRN